MTKTDMAGSDRTRAPRSKWRQRLADTGNLVRFILLAGLFVLRSAVSRRRWERARTLSKGRTTPKAGRPNQRPSGSRGRDMRAIRAAPPG